MNLESSNKWLTLIANVGVLIGIVFLSMEINQSNRIARGAAETEFRNSVLENVRFSLSQPELTELRFKVEDQKIELTQEEEYNAYLLALINFVVWAQVAQQYENGLLSDYSLQAQKDAITVELGRGPGMAQYFAQIRDEYSLGTGINAIWDHYNMELAKYGY